MSMTASPLNFAAAAGLPTTSTPGGRAAWPPPCCPSKLTFGWVQEAGFSSSIRFVAGKQSAGVLGLAKP